jgi:hypothetical protein
MIKTVFRDATLTETNLNSANMKSATFRNADLRGANLGSGVLEGASLREADLCGANLRSAVVRHATFRDANLTRADLKNATGCGSATFTAGTTFCATRMCDGSIRNDDCPDGPPAGFCCTDAECPAGESCVANRCLAEGVCRPPFREGAGECVCLPRFDGSGMACFRGSPTGAPCDRETPCADGFGFVCADIGPCSMTGDGLCFLHCPLPFDCSCTGAPIPPTCEVSGFARCGTDGSGET